jgi:hypothetical protein
MGSPLLFYNFVRIHFLNKLYILKRIYIYSFQNFIEVFPIGLISRLFILAQRGEIPPENFSTTRSHSTYIHTYIHTYTGYRQKNGAV